MVKHVPVKQALQSIADNPEVEMALSTHVWRAAAYKLFWIANTGGKPGRGRAGRKSRAQQILMNRLAGRRRVGTVPLGVTESETLEMVSLIDELADE